MGTVLDWANLTKLIGGRNTPARPTESLGGLVLLQGSVGSEKESVISVRGMLLLYKRFYCSDFGWSWCRSRWEKEWTQFWKLNLEWCTNCTLSAQFLCKALPILLDGKHTAVCRRDRTRSLLKQESLKRRTRFFVQEIHRSERLSIVREINWN